MDLALALATTKDPPCRLADIGPAPPTVLVDSAGKRFDLALPERQGRAGVVRVHDLQRYLPAHHRGTEPGSEALESAKLWKSSVEFVSISLDPKRDTPEVLRRYARRIRRRPRCLAFPDGSPLAGRARS